MSFQQQMINFSSKVESKMDHVVYYTMSYIIKRVVLKSPYGDWASWSKYFRDLYPDYTPGHFIGNWQYSADGSVYPEFDYKSDKVKQTAYLLEQMTKRGAWSKTHIMANNSSYARDLEHGYSSQAPAGFVGLTMKNTVGVVMKLAKENVL